MVSEHVFEPILASICWAYRATRYRAAIGPPIIYSLTHTSFYLSLSAWEMLGLKSTS